MNFRDRPLIITDLETTGLDPYVHVILEIGALVVDQRSLDVLHTWQVKVRPTTSALALAEPGALEVNGYSEEEWRDDAVSLRYALLAYMAYARGGVFLAQNVTFDWGFMQAALRATDVKSTLDYHRLDLASLSWLRWPELESVSLSAVAEGLGLGREPRPHRALAGAKLALEILRRIKFETTFSEGTKCL